MKPILASLLLFLSTGAHAQFSFGLTGGVNAFSNFANHNSDVYVLAEGGGGYGRARTLKSTPTCELQGYWTKRYWQFGFAIDRYLAPATGGDVYPGGTIVCGTEWSTVVETALRYKYAYPVKLFANRVRQLKRWSLSGGVSAGFIFVSNYDNKFFDQPFMLKTSSYYGLVTGAQVGVSYKCCKHLSVNARFSGEYIYINPDKISYLNTPASLGIAYSF